MATISPSERESMILERMPQVEYLARRLHRRCPQVELDDLISAGVIGLIQAVDRFDPARNLKLKTFAEHRISGALLDYLRHVDPLPRSVRRFQKQRDVLLENFGDNQPTVEESSIAWGFLEEVRGAVADDHCFGVRVFGASEELCLVSGPGGNGNLPQVLMDDRVCCGMSFMLHTPRTLDVTCAWSG